MKFAFVFLLCIFIFVETGHSYPLRVQTIVKKMSRNNGRGTYKIIREVTFETKDDREKARETWLVRNGDDMKVTVESTDTNNPWSFEIVYKAGKRKTLTSSNKIKTFKRSEEFFEPLYHDRSSKSLMNRLVQFRFVPDWAKSLPAPDYIDGKTQMKEEPFVRLTPESGTVSYALGARQVASMDKARTILWVEQDSFLIRKGHLRSKSQFTSENFQTLPGGLKLPKNQVVTWGTRLARIDLITAEAMSLSSSDLNFHKKKKTTIPDNQIIKEFYSRFR